MSSPVHDPSWLAHSATVIPIAKHAAARYGFSSDKHFFPNQGGHIQV